ncbi:MAG TPA: SRPBCC family protein [Actinomycetota bacterium]|nr:SRPBCC family protein [Actinomycetota bacterium]
MRRLILTTSVEAQPDVVFDLSTDLDLHQASMHRSRERAVAGRTSGRIVLGEWVTWRARHLGVWWTMTSRIDSFDRPVSFSDTQVRGPFGTYRHGHHFTAVGHSTVMTDVVEVAAPLGLLGKPFEGLVARYLTRLLIERNEAIARAALNLGSGGGRPAA